MTFYGADVSQLRELAKAVDKAAALLSSRASSLQGQIQSAPWKGTDGELFRQDWSGNHRPSLERVASSLRHNSKLLLQHANEQEQSSAETGSGGGGPSPSILDRLKDLGSRAQNWLEEQKAKAAAAEAHRQELKQGLDDMLKASPEEQAKWWAGLSEEDRKYLIEGEDENGPFAEDLMRMDGGIPQSAQDQASAHLRELAKTETPVYTESGKASLDARVAWFHAGAEVGTVVVENADGSATMKVYGNVGLGVNDTTGTAGVTLNGEASREYKFGSVEEAMAARNQIYTDLPPDSVGEIKDVAGNPPGYILDTINDAADGNGSTGHDDKAKGTLSLEAEGESGPASGSAKLDLAYERNLTDGTATASAEVSAQGKLNLDGRVFEASGKGGLEVNLDKHGNMDSIAVSMEGTVAEGATAGPDLQGAKAESSLTVGAQGTVKIEVEYSPENAAVIDSYMRNVALGDNVAAGQDAAKLYEAGSATVQANHVVTASNEFGIDLKAGEVEVKTENKATTNVSTYYKVPNDTKLEKL
ncbi:hypothetical protein QK290_09705 [Pseudarthrobacter sp. AL07]|uniref:hypothetical protein n=1 Tax=unclassified Pseudarthrobacter TaxID=2647000 RepID=UPI00249BFADB|nr:MULTISPECIES: hypothetical protein [unclassified Pseudarthrobacter]MDI3194783.1 hypothetical protein [Pseudarthrobacter sp. AL20]MDI3208773.1 hypothetical protein [Pseudarthrobacter sp. AL07]